MNTYANEAAKSSDTAARIVEKVVPAVQGTVDRVVEATHTLADAATRGIETLSHRRDAAIGAVRDAVVARPLGAIGVAVLAGLVLGALLRR